MKEKKSNFSDKIGRNTQRQREAAKGFGYLEIPKGVPVLRLEEGIKEVELDFVPYTVTDEKHPDKDVQFEIATKGTLWYRRPFKVHGQVGSNKESCVCLKSIGKRCPICDYQEKRRKEGADKDEIKELYPRPRSLYVVIPLGMKKYEEVPTIWDMSDYLFQTLLNEELEIDGDNNSFPDLEAGKTLTLKLRWKEIGKSSFPEARNISFSDRKPYKESILEDVPNLDEVLKVYSYETLEAKFFELEEEETGGKLSDAKEEKEDKEEQPRKSYREEEKEEKPERKGYRDRENEDRPEIKSSRKSREEEEPPARSRRKEEPDKEEKGKTDKDCPHGHTFGKDFEKFNDCDDCELWKSCFDKHKGK